MNKYKYGDTILVRNTEKGTWLPRIFLAYANKGNKVACVNRTANNEDQFRQNNKFVTMIWNLHKKPKG